MKLQNPKKDFFQTQVLDITAPSHASANFHVVVETGEQAKLEREYDDEEHLLVLQSNRSISAVSVLLVVVTVGERGL